MREYLNTSSTRSHLSEQLTTSVNIFYTPAVQHLRAYLDVMHWSLVSKIDNDTQFNLSPEQRNAVSTARHSEQSHSENIVCLKAHDGKCESRTFILYLT